MKAKSIDSSVKIKQLALAEDIEIAAYFLLRGVTKQFLIDGI